MPMPAPLTPQQLCAITARAATAAAVAVRETGDPSVYTGTTNAGGDRVLAIDLAADVAAKEALAADLAIAGQPYATLSEESGLVRHGAEYPLFVIDPVDGSAEARRRHPDCAVSIAVALGPRFGDIVAAVAQPIFCGDPYVAVRGEGAQQGGRTLPFTPVPRGRAASLLVEGIDAPDALAVAWQFAMHEPSCQVQISGSIALQLALLAAGSYDLLVAARAGARAYDIAAGWLLVVEAGAAYADLQGIETATAPLTDMAMLHRPIAARRQDLLESAIRVARGTP
jgi:myo-inositol-1(or 4)-monophosphatase